MKRGKKYAELHREESDSKMIRSDEMGIWHFREVKVTLSASECMLINDSIMQFHKEFSEKKHDVFREGFSEQVNLYDVPLAQEFFSQLIKSNANLRELKNLREKELKQNEDYLSDPSSFSFDSEDPFGFGLSSQIGDVGNKAIEIEIALLPLVNALKICNAYKREMNYRDNQEISSHESDDWTPPSNFANGTDAEREIWEDFQRSQKSRK